MSAFVFHLLGGTLNVGTETIEWEVYDSNDVLVTSGVIVDEPLDFSIDLATFPTFNPNTKCYKVRWRKDCPADNMEWIEKKIGMCKNEIVGEFNAILTGGGRSGGPVKMTIDFAVPTPGDITFEAGYDLKVTSGGYLDHSSGYNPPRTYTGFIGCGITEVATPKTIPAGTTHYETLSTCADIGSPYGYIEKIVFFNLVLPAGYTLALNPSRANLSYEVR